MTEAEGHQMQLEQRRQEEEALAESLKIAAYADAMLYRDRTAVLEGNPDSLRDLNTYRDKYTNG